MSTSTSTRTAWRQEPVLHAVVCAAPKDFLVLPLSVRSIFRYTPVKHVAVVTSTLPALQSFSDTVDEASGRRMSTKQVWRLWNQRAQRLFSQNHTFEFVHPPSGNNITFVHEVRFMPLSKEAVRLEMKNKTVGNGPGWYLQQFIKLYAYRVLRLDSYLVVDADVVFTQPVMFAGQRCDGASSAGASAWASHSTFGSATSDGSRMSWGWPHCYAFWRQRKPSREDASYFQQMRCLTNGALKQV